MYGFGWSIVGMAIVVIVLLDAVWTTLTVSRSGWPSAMVVRIVGRISMRGPHYIAENASVFASCASFLLWALLLWAGWAVFFCGATDAVLNSATRVPANLIDRVYFAGFTLTTLGVGDFRPSQGIWQVATAIAAANGFVLFTLSVTYMISVISALNIRRSLGVAVANLGTSPEDIALLLADGGKQALTTRLINLTAQIESSSMQTDAYPVLEYSHLDDPKRSFSCAIVKLGELSLLMEHAISPEQSLPAAVWRPLRHAVDLLVREKHDRPQLETDATPELPDFRILRDGGLILATEVAQAYSDSSVRKTRSRWVSWLRWHGHEWSDLRAREESGAAGNDAF